MKVPYAWLSSFFEDLPPLDRVVDLLSGLGLGVEAVEELPGAPAGVVVAVVTGIEPIVGGEGPVLANVEDGTRSYRVVCGAPNVRAGLLTALALPGTLLAEGAPVETRRVHGAASEGVLCSPRELGLFDFGGGLIEFASDVAPGQRLNELWPGDSVIELELTPNRADAFSLLGVARDLAAKLGVGYRHPAADLPPADPSVPDGLTVQVDDSAGCPRFTLRRIDGVQVGPSPVWLQRRLAAVGLRPRNNVVDVTNYVTFELGQPSHAYDREVLNEGTLIVRRARPGESLVALNEDDLTFAAEDLLITTPGAGGSRPIGVAGVIGGLHDSVREGTSSVALEVAHFDPVSIRRTARRLGLSTDAHYRFERGVDPNLPPLASARAVRLIEELTGGRAHPGITDTGVDVPLRQVPLRPSRVAFLMDMEIPPERQRGFLERLGCTVDPQRDDHWQVTVPSWRFDLAIEEDLIEEVSRLHGFEHIGETVPAMHFVPNLHDPTHGELRDTLAAVGFQETINYVFTSAQELAGARAPAPVVQLLNPQSAERSVLRTALFPGLLGVARTNRAVPSLALFEIGRVFGSEEVERLALLASGRWIESGWRPGTDLDFYLFKGLLERLAATHRAELNLQAADLPHLHPGVAAVVQWNGVSRGTAGMLHPEVAARFGLERVFLAELELPLPPLPIGFRDPNRQPHAERDLAVVVPLEVPYRAIADLVGPAAGSYLESLSPFDVYQGEQVPEGFRSIALRFCFRHPERALRDEEVDADMTNVIGLVRAAGYDIRE